MRERLRNLMVLFTMVFLPNLAWADYTYGGQSLTFYYTGDSGPNYYYSGSGDNQVTEWNVTADAFYQSNSSLYSGFSYVKLTNVNPLSGPLTGFTLAGSINNNNVNLKVYRLATLSATERTLIGSITIGGSDVPSYTYIAEDGVSQSFNNEYIQLAIERSSSETTPTFTTGQITNITLTFSGTDYGISVGNYRVTSNNATDIFGDGNASFTAASGDTPATLTLNGVTIGTSTVNSSIISNLEDEQLTINLVGTNKLYGFINDASNAGTLKFTGTGSLDISNDGDVVSNFDNVTIDDGLYIQSNEPGVHWDSYNSRFAAQRSGLYVLTITPDVYYPIWVVSSNGVDYIQVSGTNKNHVLGENNTTVKYENDQLILDGFVCSTTEGKPAIVLGNQEEFKIYLSGDNTISSGGTGDGVYFNREVAFLTVSTDKDDPGTLTLGQPSSGNYSLTNVPYDCVIYENGLGFYNNTVSTVWPRLAIGNTQIMGTTDNVLDDENISFDAGTNTLTLSGAVIEGDTYEPDIDVYVKDLIVAISGTNTVNGRFYGHYSLNGDNVGTIHFTKAEGATSPSITISGDTGDSGPVYEFSQCTWDNDLYLTEAKTAGGDNVPGVYYGNSRFTNGNAIPKTVKISTEPSGVILWIGEKAVTSANASNIFAEEGYLDGKVSFTVEDNKNVLILDGANLMEYPIVSDLPNLTIRFKEDCSLFTITSNKTNATLRFEKAGDASDGTQLTGSGLDGSLWSGFEGGVTFGGSLAYFANADTWYIYNLSSPKISIENNVVSFGVSFGNNNVPITNTNDFNFFYTLQYEDANQQSVTTFTQYDPQNPLTINKASVLTVKVRYKYAEDYSDVSIGKYFDSAEDPMRLVYGADPVDLVLVPAIEESDGISILGIEANVTYNAETGKVSSTVLGTTGGSVAMNTTVGKTLVLNNYFTMNFEVVPPAPTINLDAGTYLDTHDPITITSSNLANTTIKYKWNNGDAADYPAGGINIQTGTLKAWVEHTSEGTTVASDVTSVAYTVKTDISDYTVTGLSTTAAYTGTAVNPGTPTITDQTGTPLTKDTDYTVTYKKKLEGDGYETVESMTDVGNYLIVIAGTGSFGGGQEFDFEITRASVDWTATGWTSPQAKADLSFTNEAKDLITAATVPDGVTVKYCYKYSTSEFGDEALSTLPDPANWTTTVPQGTNVGYYAVFYKVEESANYGVWGPCEVALQTSIAPKVTTFTVLLADPDEVITYDGTEKTPDITVKDGDTELNVNTDYTITVYSNNINAAASTAATPPTVTIAGAGNYNGSTGSATFTISKAQLTVTPDDKTYNVGDNIELTVSYDGFVDGDDEDVLTTEPTASYGESDVTKAGIYTITASGGEAANYDFVYETGTLTINRLLDVSFSASNEWATYYGTEDLATPEGLKAYQVTAVGASEVTSSAIDYIPANTAILLKNVSGNVSWSGISASAYTGATSTFENNILKGSAEAVSVSTITGGTVYILINNMFRRASSGTIPANRAYLVVSGAAAARLNIVHGGNDTGIHELRIENEELRDEWYDLQGRRIEKPMKNGLYIRNGKKVYKKVNR